MYLSLIDRLFDRSMDYNCCCCCLLSVYLVIISIINVGVVVVAETGLCLTVHNKRALDIDIETCNIQVSLLQNYGRFQGAS